MRAYFEESELRRVINTLFNLSFPTKEGWSDQHEVSEHGWTQLMKNLDGAKRAGHGVIATFHIAENCRVHVVHDQKFGCYLSHGSFSRQPEHFEALLETLKLQPTEA